MLTIDTPTLENGAIKASINATDLVEAAINLRSVEAVSNRLGYSVLLMQTGLEEAAKASFLFEKYVSSLRKGRIRISEKKWKHWMGSRQSHAKRIARVQYLYALSDQVSSMPGATIVFPQGVNEMLKNRNAALYVDFNHNDQSFVSPTEAVDTGYLTANAGFARHILHFTSFDKVIEAMKSTILNNQEGIKWFTESIEREMSRKRHDVLDQVEKHKKQYPNSSNLFNKDVERIFCAKPRPNNEFGLLYSCMKGTQDDSVFYMDTQTNHFAIHPDGKVVHARFAQTVEVPVGYRHEWEIIDTFESQ